MSAERRPRPLLSIAEAAELLGKSRSAAYELARRNELPGLVELNGRYHVKRLVLLAWLAGDVSPATSTDEHTTWARQGGAADHAAAREGHRVCAHVLSRAEDAKP